MRKFLNKLNSVKQKPAATAGSSSASLSSQQRADNRQPDALAEAGKPLADTASTLTVPRDNESQNVPVEASELPASAAATSPAPRNDSQQDEALAVGGGILTNTAEAVVPPANSPSVDHIGKKDDYGIKVLYGLASADIDIVFIHGLTGSAYTTWLHEESGVHWPRDLLKNDLKGARIMTFGYDVDVVNIWKHAAQDGISGYANDLLGSLAGRREGISVYMIFLNLGEISDNHSRETTESFSSLTALVVWSPSGL